MKLENDIFRIKRNEVAPARGCTLIAEPFMRSAYFQRSVVLLTDHGDETKGFVLNKKTNLVMNDYLSNPKDIPKIHLYLGGPVAANRVFFIHTLGDIVEGSQKIRDGLYFDGDFKILLHYLLNDKNISEKVKFFLGYSGWSRGQLEDEIDDNSWIVAHSSNSGIINASDESFWNVSMSLLGKKYDLWSKYPKDPSVN